MGLFKIIFYILLGYLAIQFVRLILAARKVVKQGNEFRQNGMKKEKDISRVARIVGEERLDQKSKKSDKKK